MADFPHFLGLGYNSSSSTTRNNGDVNNIHFTQEGNPAFPVVSSSSKSDGAAMMHHPQGYCQEQAAAAAAAAAYQSYWWYYYQQQQQHQQQLFPPLQSFYHTTTAASITAPTEGEGEVTHNDDANRIAKSMVQKMLSMKSSAVSDEIIPSKKQEKQCVVSPPEFVKALQPDDSSPPSTAIHWNGTHSKPASTTSLFSNFSKATSTINSGKEYSEARQKFFQQVEYPRIQLAFIKNLEYVHNQQELQLKTQLEKLTSTTTMCNNYTFTHQLDKKKQALLVTKAGIGTKQRNAAITTFGAGNQQQKQQQQQTSGIKNSSILYVSGLLPPATKEETVQQLFESYSNATTPPRITFYKHPQTGLWKGDALVVYEEESPPDANDICLQLNGAILPCGSTLTVQPADFHWKKKKKNQDSTAKKEITSTDASIKRDNDDIRNTVAVLPATEVTTARADEVIGKAGENIDDEEDDDLDGFFASLE